ncbi:hypothetical protein CVT24_010780, partial [Panaeolus cyanescens]
MPLTDHHHSRLDCRSPFTCPFSPVSLSSLPPSSPHQPLSSSSSKLVVLSSIHDDELSLSRFQSLSLILTSPGSNGTSNPGSSACTNISTFYTVLILLISHLMSHHKSIAGSRSARVAIGKSAPYSTQRRPTKLGVQQANEAREETMKSVKEAEKELSQKTKHALNEMRKEAGMSSSTVEAQEATEHVDTGDTQQGWVDVDDGMRPELLASAVDDAVVDPKWSFRYLRDARTWRQRQQRVQHNWAPQLESLTAAYLQTTYPRPQSPPPQPKECSEPPITIDTDVSMSPSCSAPSSPADSLMSQDDPVPSTVPNANDPVPPTPQSSEPSFPKLLPFDIRVIDLYTLASTATIPRRDDQITSVALVEAGYIGNSPISPSIAISLRTLELYCLLRQRKPSFSFEAFVKVLCDLYQ